MDDVQKKGIIYTREIVDCKNITNVNYSDNWKCEFNSSTTDDFCFSVSESVISSCKKETNIL